MDELQTIITKLERQRKGIETALLSLRGIGSNGPSLKTTTMSTSTNGKPKRSFSAATRRKMAEAQQKRWAEKRGTQPTEVPAEVTAQVAPQAINRRSRKVQSRSAA